MEWASHRPIRLITTACSGLICQSISATWICQLQRPQPFFLCDTYRFSMLHTPTESRHETRYLSRVLNQLPFTSSTHRTAWTITNLVACELRNLLSTIQPCKKSPLQPLALPHEDTIPAEDVGCISSIPTSVELCGRGSWPDVTR